MNRFYHGRGMRGRKIEIKRDSVSRETAQFSKIFDTSSYLVIYVVCT